MGLCMYSIVIHTSSKAANFVKRTCKIKSRLDSISMSSKLVGHLVGVAKCHHRCQLPTSCPTPCLPYSLPACLPALHVDVAYRQSKHSYQDSVYCRVPASALPSLHVASTCPSLAVTCLCKSISENA